MGSHTVTRRLTYVNAPHLNIGQINLPFAYPKRMNKKFELMLTRRAKAYKKTESMPMLICNCFHERLANIRKIATFTRIPTYVNAPHLNTGQINLLIPEG